MSSGAIPTEAGRVLQRTKIRAAIAPLLAAHRKRHEVTVDKTLESGGLVIPRHITMAKDAPEKAAAFVRAIIAKQGFKK